MIENVKIDYLGWSGFQIKKNSGPNLFIDPPKGTEFPDDEIIILITHGHPEHLGGTIDHLSKSTSNHKTIIIATKPLCYYFKRRCIKSNVEFIYARTLETISPNPNYQITPFMWKHMPLLPPGIKNSIRHVWQLIKGYKHAFKILKMTLKGPNQIGDMLGYIVKLKDKNIIKIGRAHV